MPEHPADGTDIEVATPRSYRGRRTDFQRRGGYEDYEGPLPPDRRDLEASVIRILEGRGIYGCICSELADATGVTKEWMRRILNDLERRTLVGHRRVGPKTRLWYARSIWEKYQERWPQ